MRKTYILTISALLVFFLISSVEAAQVYGTLYDLSLNKVDYAVIEINSDPLQRVIAANGTYSFEISPGKYTLFFYDRDTREKIAIEENISIVAEGNYHIDLIIYPEYSAGLDDTPMDLEPLIDEEASERTIPILFLTAGIAIVAASIIFLFRRRNVALVKTNAMDDSARLIQLMKLQGGRISQKDLRKEFPFSETKISLMITELEAEGKLKKIKKGRSNVLILVD